MRGGVEQELSDRCLSREISERWVELATTYNARSDRIEPSFESQPPDRRNSYFRSGEQTLAEGMDGGLDLSFVEISPAKIVRDNAAAIRESGPPSVSV